MSHSTLAALSLLALAMAGCSDGASTPGSSSGGTMTQAFPACDAEFTVTAPNPNNVWTPNAITLVSQELAPRVFAIYDANADTYAPMGKPLATSGGFVIGEDGVLLVESMINKQLFCQVIALVRKETDKPITHVINTSSHGDHSFGNTFLPSGVHVVQHEVTAADISQHFEEDVAFMKANFGADQGLDEIKPVAADILVKDQPFSVDLGGITVEARFFGFAQTGGDLFVDVPTAKVLWTGNAIVAEKPAIPWLLDGHAEETGVTLAAVKASLPADAIVVPGHGRPLNVDEGFDYSVDYLGELINQVDSAVMMGLSEQDTVKAVTMDTWKGYAIWDWIHTTVNVPKTYQERSTK